MSRRRVWIALGVGVAVLGAVATGLVGLRVARAAGDKPAQDLLPAGMQNHPLGRLLGHSLGRLQALRDELQVTPDQKQEIKTILQSHRQEIVIVAREVRDEHRKLQAAASAQPLDEAAVRKAASDMAGTIADAAILRAKVQREVQSKLTPAQVEKLKTFHKDVAGRVDRALGGAAAQ